MSFFDLDLVTLLIILVGLVQLPLLVDFLHHAFPSSRIARLASKATRPLFIALFFGSCALALQFFFSCFLHLHAAPNSYSYQSAFSSPLPQSFTPSISLLLLSILALYIVGQMCDNYLNCILTKPSFAPHQYNIQVPPQKYRSSVISTSVASFKPCSLCPPPSLSSSSASSTPMKSYRVSHCRICEQCIVLFDHHCPFTGCCIGIENFRAFWCWLTWTLIGLIYSTILSFPAFYQCVWNRHEIPSSSSDLSNISSSLSSSSTSSSTLTSPSVIYSPALCTELGNYIWTVVPVVFGLVSVAIMWAFETALIWADITTAELIRRLTGGERSEETKGQEENFRADGTSLEEGHASNGKGNGDDQRNNDTAVAPVVVNGINKRAVPSNSSILNSNGFPAVATSVPCAHFYRSGGGVMCDSRLQKSSNLILAGKPWWCLLIPKPLWSVINV